VIAYMPPEDPSPRVIVVPASRRVEQRLREENARLRDEITKLQRRLSAQSVGRRGK